MCYNTTVAYGEDFPYMKMFIKKDNINGGVQNGKVRSMR